MVTLFLPTMPSTGATIVVYFEIQFGLIEQRALLLLDFGCADSRLGLGHLHLLRSGERGLDLSLGLFHLRPGLLDVLFSHGNILRRLDSLMPFCASSGGARGVHRGDGLIVLLLGNFVFSTSCL